MRTGPLLAPEIATAPRAVYSFQDVLALRTFVRLVAVIGDVIEPFAVRAGVLVPHLLRPRPCLAVDPETQGGTPVIAGTRVPYDAVAGLMRDGVSAERIRDYYPSVTAVAAADVLDLPATSIATIRHQGPPKMRLLIDEDTAVQLGVNRSSLVGISYYELSLIGAGRGLCGAAPGRGRR